MKKGSKLLIVESPAKIKTISKFLGGEYSIMSTFGHIKDLPSKKLGITIEGEKGPISLEYAVIEDKKQKITSICKQAAQSDEIYLASDPDREGEIIAWHIRQEIEKVIKDPSKIYRITFNEITKPAVTEAIKNKTTIDTKKVQAQQARRALDRWVGYEVSPILWRKIKKGLSAGRVQSAALLLICNREEEIVNFKPEESWSIHGTFKHTTAQIIAELVSINNKKCKLNNKEETDKILGELKKESYHVKDITTKKRLKKPLPPFMTSTLQQDAFNKLGFSVDRTMRIAQKLYEGIPLDDKNKPEALITYMRTDSLRLSNTALNDAQNYISTHYGADYLPKKATIYTKAAAQDAHEAIRPINTSITPDYAARYLTAEQAKLYGLIWRRFVACQMTPAEYSQRQVTIEGGKYLFRVTGSTLVFDGFLKVYDVEDDEKAVKIPKTIKKGLQLDLIKLDPKQHFTQPPPRYSEASLVKEMEKQGIGRPSTYAATLSTIQKRDYASKEKKRFMPTELGKSVNKMLITNLPDIINLHFTAEMEEVLDRIAQGRMDRDDVLLIFYRKFQKDLKEFAGKDLKKETVPTDLSCQKCSKPLVIRFGKTGEFVGCSGFPECTFTSNFIRNPDESIELMKPKEVEITCPHCGKQLVQKSGKYGPFLACPGYPECKYIHQESLEMPCPKCKGKIVKRRSARGSFWGCSNYPKCTFAIFGDVEEMPCPKCQSPYMLIKKNEEGQVTNTCPNKECNFTKTS